MKNGLQTSARILQDSNFDGKADSFGIQRKATSRDVFDAAPAPLASVPGIGGDLGGIVPANAHQVSWTEGASYLTKSWDTNGDWNADLTETDSLDANRNVVSRSFSVNVPAAADGSGAGSITLCDSNNDGKVDWVSLYGNDGSSYSLADNDRDGKLDYRTESKTANGVSTTLMDDNGDGKADQVSTWTTLA